MCMLTPCAVRPGCAGKAATGTHNTTSGFGRLVDAGICPDSDPSGAQCNQFGQNLNDTGYNLSGAVAVLNLWQCDTAAQHVLSHAPGTSAFTYNATHQRHCDSLQFDKSRYYVEGPRELMDSPTEWSYDQALGRTYLWTRDGEPPAVTNSTIQASRFCHVPAPLKHATGAVLWSLPGVPGVPAFPGLSGFHSPLQCSKSMGCACSRVLTCKPLLVRVFVCSCGRPRTSRGR